MKYLILFGLMLLTGCASIVTGAFDDVTIKSTPSGVPFTVQNKEGQIVSRGTTPQEVSLKKGDGYFDYQVYRVNYNLTGYYPQTSVVDASINSWYFGNLLFGGIIVGGIIVDPLTGAMWTLQDESSTVLFQIK